ncbi:hypothetical protein DRQ09_00905 [candidate division KSB1 bacterium]|nr:MAG: hypothetical protein DRQ09_00905 [candidate division KSB1 bacterium]
MSEKVKQDNNLQLNQRIEEFNDIKLLFNTFGETAYRAAWKYFFSNGYEVGYERFMKAVKKGTLTPEKFKSEPVKTIENFLKEFFRERGGNQPEIWSENSTIFLKTERDVWCPAHDAVAISGINHKDICSIHKRAFVIGIVKTFEEFFPGLTTNCYNVSSRFLDENADCIEAYQIIYYG